MVRFSIVLAAAVFLAEQATADQIGAFDCVAFSDFEQASVRTDLMRIGSFSLHEQLSGTDKQSAGITLSYTATNDTKGLVYISGDFLFLGAADEPLAAFSATPVKLYVEARKSMVVNGFTIVKAGTLAAVRKVCTRIHLSSPL